MSRNILKYIKFLSLLIFLFAFYWFLNNGFLMDSLWLPIQSGIFALATYLIFKYREIKIKFSFLMIGLLYVLSSAFEIFKLHQISVMMASTGFGLLMIVVIARVVEETINNRTKRANR